MLQSKYIQKFFIGKTTLKNKTFKSKNERK